MIFVSLLAFLIKAIRYQAHLIADTSLKMENRAITVNDYLNDNGTFIPLSWILTISGIEVEWSQVIGLVSIMK